MAAQIKSELITNLGKAIQEISIEASDGGFLSHEDAVRLGNVYKLFEKLIISLIGRSKEAGQVPPHNDTKVDRS